MNISMGFTPKKAQIRTKLLVMDALSWVWTQISSDFTPWKSKSESSLSNQKQNQTRVAVLFPNSFNVIFLHFNCIFFIYNELYTIFWHRQFYFVLYECIFFSSWLKAFNFVVGVVLLKAERICHVVAGYLRTAIIIHVQIKINLSIKFYAIKLFI